MRLCLALAVTALVAPIFAHQAPGQLSPPAPARSMIRGVIKAAETGQPIRGAEVRIESPVPSRPNEARSAITDENGRYEIRDVAAGRYTPYASKVGFVTTSYGQRRSGEAGRPVDVRPGAVVNAIDIALQRGSVIVARIVDGFGVPVPGLTVRLFQYQFVDGQRALQPNWLPQINATDDRGEARLFGLPSGDYLVAASPQISTAGVERNFVQTLYPGTALVSQALPVRVGTGEEVQVTWRMVQQPPVRISGMVFDSNGAPVANAAIQFGHEQLAGFTSDVTAAVDGTFTAENLTRGEYRINVPALQISHRLRAVDDVASLVLRPERMAVLRGRVLSDDPGDPPRVTRLRIRPLPLYVSFEGTTSSISLPIRPDGTFDTAIAGSGVLQVPRLPGSPEWFLKSILVEGRELPLNRPIDFASLDGRTLQIVLTRQRGTVTGTVVDPRGNTAVDCTVIAFAIDSADWTPLTERIAASRPNHEGRFELRGLPPGRYLVAAVDSLEAGEERYAPTLERLRGFALSVAVTDGQTQTVNVRLDR